MAASDPTPEHVPVRDAATLILVRDPGHAPHILMGRRARNAVFMPNKWVFPGGAVDASDADVALAGALDPLTHARLSETERPPEAFAAAALRELWEEAGLAFAARDTGTAPGWPGYPDGLCPNASGLVLVFRAVTPPGRPRRFDARFFMADAAGIAGDAEDFSGASGELSDLAWVPAGDLDGLDLAPITRAALATALPLLPDIAPPQTLTFLPMGAPQNREA